MRRRQLLTAGLGALAAPVATASLTATVAHAAYPPGPLVPIRQGQGQPGQWSDCGPTSVVMVILAMGKTPHDWNPAQPVHAIIDVQEADHMNLPSIDGATGTTPEQLQAGLTSYAIASTQVTTVDGALAKARAGRPAIINGQTLKFPWPQNAYEAVNHWAVLGGHDPADGSYLVLDPASKPEANEVHRVTAAQVRTFMEARGRIMAVAAA